MQVVNPKAVREVEVEGAKFKVGIIPYGKRAEIESMAYFNREVKTAKDVEALLLQNFELVRWGIKGCETLNSPDGAIVFTTKKARIGEVEYDIVSDDLMEVFGATLGLITSLAKVVSEFNYVDGKTAKN